MSASLSHPSAAILETSGLVCGYGGKRIIKSADVTLERGECLAVVGPNGAGKTTLLRTLSGFLAPIEGQVLVEGATVHGIDPAERARRIAVLPQDSRVDPRLTVREVVSLGRTPHLGAWGRLARRDEDAIGNALERLELAPLAERRVGEISGGERQRARLAMVLAQGATLALLDEPAAHLDLKRRYELSTLIRRLREQDRLTVVAVVHDLAGLLDFASRVLVISDGRSELLDATDPERVADRLRQAFDVPSSWIGALRTSPS